MATVYSSTGTCGGRTARQWRVKLTYTTTTGNTSVSVSWTATIQMKSAAQYGVYLECGGKDTTGYITSSSSDWKDVCSVSGTTSYTRTTSAQTKKLTASGEGRTVSGYSAADGSLSVSASISVPALASYTVSYNANGGSGAPSSQKKWYGTALTLSSTKPTRTGYSFSKWNTASGGTGTSYAAGASYTANAAATLYAQWTANTYTVSYNANGGSGAPSSQTKTYGSTLTLSNTKPTRTNYNFLGWATSASATTAQYAAGGSFTTNAATTLYAVWELAYWKPKITNLKVSRASKDANGAWVADDFGLYGHVTFSYEFCQLLGENKASSAKIVCNGTTYSLTLSNTEGSAHYYVGGSLSVDSQYEVTVTLVDTIQGGSTSAGVTIPRAAFALDFLAGGGGVAFGRPATQEGFESAWTMRIKKESSSAFFVSERTDSSNQVAFGVGSTGTNRGIYDLTLDKWLFHTDGSSVFINEKTLLDTMYPVGTVYISYTSTSPASLFGGTWTAITGRFPYFNAGTATGGSNTHTLTTAQMPAHTHAVNYAVTGVRSGSYWQPATTNIEGSSSSYVNSTGGGGSHNNMPAYQTLYAWRRTA